MISVALDRQVRIRLGGYPIKMMKLFYAISLFGFLLFPAGGQVSEKPLTAVDQQLLLQRLAEIRSGAKNQIDDRNAAAIAAFRAGAESEAAAVELYVKCVEKISFQDEAKKASEFRDWKKRFRDRKDTPEFRRALRHQLRWLLLAMEMGKGEKAKEDIANDAVVAMKSVLADHDRLEGARPVLQEAVLSSVFSRAYEVKVGRAANFPSAPLRVRSIYAKLIFPPLRAERKGEELRKKWLEMIEYEGRIAQKWGDDKNTDRGRNPEFEKWYYEVRPQLLWDMEVDLFQHSSQRKAALSMLKFLEKNLSHAEAETWIGEFTNLVELSQDQDREKQAAYLEKRAQEKAKQREGERAK